MSLPVAVRDGTGLQNIVGIKGVEINDKFRLVQNGDEFSGAKHFLLKGIAILSNGDGFCPAGGVLVKLHAEESSRVIDADRGAVRLP